MAEVYTPPTYEPEPQPKRDNTVLIIVIIVAVLLLCCCCLAIGALGWLWSEGELGHILPLLLTA